MNTRNMVIGTMLLTAGLATAQNRKATLVGGGDAGRGKCTVEVTVDSSAQVEVRGDTATLRNTGGQTPQWRRFECTGAMPANPANFRFAGVDGRGRQTLTRDPRNGGVAVIDIQDSQGGSEGYTFDLFWGNDAPVSGGFRNDGPDGRDRDRNDRDYRNDRGPGRRMSDEQAFDVCRRSIQQQAADRFRTPNVDIRNISVDNNPGRRDWITGDVVVRRRFGRQDAYGFTCSVNFDNGVVRSSHIDQFERRAYQGGKAIGR